MDSLNGETRLDNADADSISHRRSYYENSVSNNTNLSSSNNNMNKECNLAGVPTQTHFLNTTVPQNIAGLDIAGKHTPTRNSLRHSRMIVLNRSGQATNHTPAVLKYKKLTKLLLITVIVLGIILCILSLWFFVWAPNIKSRDNPYWSAVPVLFSGTIGITYINSYPKQFPDRKPGFWIQSLKYVSITTSVIATIASAIIFVLAMIQIVILASLTCTPFNKLNTTCICRQNSTVDTIDTVAYHYVDLGCSEVDGILKIFIIVIIIISAITVIIKSMYLYLHWTSRNGYVYSRVPTNGTALKVYETHR